MRLCALLLAVSCLPSAVSGQWLESTILLPDSFGASADLGPSVYSRTCNTLYVGGDSGILAIDGATNRKVALIQVGSGVGPMCLNPTGTKLYYACGDSVLVIDCASNRVTASIWIQRWAVAFCFNTTGSKLYVGTDQLVIVDVAGDTVLGTRPVSGIRTMCFNPVENKLYCGTRDTLRVVSGTSDSILAVIPVGLDPTALCLNPVENKLYCTYPGEFGPPPLPESIVAVVDCAGDSVLCSIAVTAGPGRMCYNVHTNRLYVDCRPYIGGAVCVIDGAGDSLLSRLNGVTGPLCLDSTRNIIYCGDGDRLAIIDALGDSIVGHVLLRISSESSALHHDPQRNVIYCVNPHGNGVLVVDCASRTIGDRVPTACWSGALLYVPGPDKVYCADYGPDYGPGWNLVVVDAAANTTAGTIFVGARPAALCSNASGTKVYCANEESGTVSVIDAWADSLVTTVPVGSLPCAVCYNTARDRVYCCGTGAYPQPDTVVTVIDGLTDSVVAAPVVGQGPCALCHASEVNKVYVPCLVDQWVAVVDGAGDSVLTRISTGGTSPYVVCYASRENKVYVGHGVSEFVTVIDCATDSVVATVPSGQGSGDVCYNAVSNKVYDWARLNGRLTVIDAAADTVMATLSFRSGRGTLCHDTLFNKVYLVRYDSVVVIDGATNAVLTSIPLLRWGTNVAWNPVQGRVYVSNSESSCLSVIADSATGIREGRTPYAVSHTPRATIVRRVLQLADGPRASSSPSWLLDIAGRKVLDLLPGENDIRHLAPGVYFIRGPKTEDGGPRTALRKVVVTP